MRAKTVLLYTLFLLVAAPAQAGFHDRYEEHAETLQALVEVSDATKQRLARLDEGEAILVTDLLEKLQTLGRTYNSLSTGDVIRKGFKKRMLSAGRDLHALHLQHKNIGPDQPERQRAALAETARRVNYASKLLYKYGYGLHQQRLLSFMERTGCDVETPESPDAVTTWPETFRTIHKKLRGAEKQARTTCFNPGDEPTELGDLLYVPNSLVVEVGS